MRRELRAQYTGTLEEPICAHCGHGQGGSSWNDNCDCPGHLDKIIVGFDEMPDLPERLEGFEEWLEQEPCTADGACHFLSQTTRKCPACRLRLAFFHTIYNADAYR